MPKITFISHTGESQTVEAAIGDSVMEAAVNNDIDGIDADCGGACACATCHVFVDEKWMSVVGQAEELETQMLDVSGEITETSRLACQIFVSEDMDGLVVTTPESQY